MQIGKKKLVLDHLIVQKMDDDVDGPGENFQSILTYGAQALFDADQTAKDISCACLIPALLRFAHGTSDSEHDVLQLIEKTETEGDATDAPKEGGAAFSFAKIWSADKDQLDEVPDDDQVDSWAQTLEKINEELQKEKNEEMLSSGRGARRKAADAANVSSLPCTSHQLLTHNLFFRANSLTSRLTIPLRVRGKTVKELDLITQHLAHPTGQVARILRVTQRQTGSPRTRTSRWPSMTESRRRKKNEAGARRSQTSTWRMVPRAWPWICLTLRCLRRGMAFLPMRLWLGS